MTATPLKLGVLLPTRALVMRDEPPKDANPVLEMALRAEAAGLDSVWVGDSLSAKPRMEPLTTLAALATHTQRVRLGTAVLLGALRHPVLLAQMVGTLDLLSQGRAVLAVGAGGAFNEAQKQELRIAGVDPRQRGRRLEEVVQVLKALGTGHLEVAPGPSFSAGKRVNASPARAERRRAPSSSRATFAPSERPSSEGPPVWATGSSLSPSRRRSSPRWDAALRNTPRNSAGTPPQWSGSST